MSEFSARSQELARQLGEKAARNLERSGKTVVRSATTGRYIVKSAEKRTLKETHKG